jgi:translation elongation factor EF-G
LRPLEFPDPIFGLAIETTKRGDEQRLWDILEKLAAEDPCVEVERVKSTNETVVKGLGELHLRTVLERMASQYKLEVRTHPPRIAYRETITAPAEGHNRHKGNDAILLWERRMPRRGAQRSQPIRPTRSRGALTRAFATRVAPTGDPAGIQ